MQSLLKQTVIDWSVLDRMECGLPIRFLPPVEMTLSEASGGIERQPAPSWCGFRVNSDAVLTRRGLHPVAGSKDGPALDIPAWRFILVSNAGIHHKIDASRT